MIRAGIIGATGYAGAELLRILTNHPAAEVVGVSSKSFEGKKVSDVYPALYGICDMVCTGQQEVVEKSDVVFACLPHGLSQGLAAECDAAGKVFIDLGADFRLTDEAEYEEWYGGRFDDAGLHKKAVYGLPELFRDVIAGSRLIANPGCYPTSAALGIVPALEKGLVNGTVIIDSKSGTTGAGRGLSQTTHFPDCNEAFSPYKIASHRHTPEIEQTLSHFAGEKLCVVFTPHLLPVNRGIVSTIYAKLGEDVTAQDIREAYVSRYAGEKFVRVLDEGCVANLRDVRCSNYCNISLHVDARTGMLIAVSAIDNMVKGAAGQAVQNMNIVMGIPEDTGLNMIPNMF